MPSTTDVNLVDPSYSAQVASPVLDLEAHCAQLEQTLAVGGDPDIADNTARQRSSILRALALALGGLLLSCAGAGKEVAQVLLDLQREEFRISVLTLNLRGIHEAWGPDENAPDATVIPWRDRYERVATWMKSSQITPDIITLQEVWGYHTCPVTGYTARNYDTLFELIRRIRAGTGAEYRIAYLMVQRIPQGLCSLWAGNALLYNPKRIRNTLPWAPDENVFEHDELSIVDVHLRKSLPCTTVTPGFEKECALIDGAGLGWQVLYKRAPDGRNVFGPSFARLELDRQRGYRFNIYTEHLDFNDYAAGKLALKDIVDTMETRFGDGRLYPPLMTGDFNLGLSDMGVETTEEGRELEPFGIAGYSENDVMGVLVGDRDKFPSRFAANVEAANVLPVDGRDPSDRYCGGSVAALWSDHCGVLVRFVPSE